MVAFCSQIVSNSVHIFPAILLSISFDIDEIVLLIGVELKLIDAAMDGADDLAGCTFIEIHLKVGVAGAFVEGEGAIGGNFAFVVVDVDEFAEEFDVA
jgi:hypothetical protein